MNVPFLDIRATWDELADPLGEALLRVGSSGWYIGGPEVEAFERAYAEYVGARHCIGVANGLDALTLSLAAMGVGPGDEVIVPSNTYIATWLAITAVGATIVPVEPDPSGWNLEPERVEAAITPRTRVVLPVHLYGLPVDLPALAEVCARHGVRLLDDAAQAHGAYVGGRRIGVGADATAWSFYPSKNLGALGDGGAVTTDDEQLADDLRMRRNYGSRVKYHNEILGVNSRLDPLQAAVLRVKLAKLDEWNARRVVLANHYLGGLEGLPLELPVPVPDTRPVWHVFPVLVEDRAGVSAALRERGVETLIHYPVPPHLQPAYAHLGWGEGTFPVSERLHARELSLPIGPHLSLEQVDRVVDALRSVFG
ncbi:MAG: DegT/DnrJ/EryC1/StrS family aminotransferase [Myxococcales bacterium]|nr:DegT/DnrJ/EryC1/StrS family aminotransferase [Myxococcales bacterium]